MPQLLIGLCDLAAFCVRHGERRKADDLGELRVTRAHVAVCRRGDQLGRNVYMVRRARRELRDAHTELRVVLVHELELVPIPRHRDRKSTRLNSSHITISYAVFCLKKKKN